MRKTVKELWEISHSLCRTFEVLFAVSNRTASYETANTAADEAAAAAGAAYLAARDAARRAEDSIVLVQSRTQRQAWARARKMADWRRYA